MCVHVHVCLCVYGAMVACRQTECRRQNAACQNAACQNDALGEGEKTKPGEGEGAKLGEAEKAKLSQDKMPISSPSHSLL